MLGGPGMNPRHECGPWDQVTASAKRRTMNKIMVGTVVEPKIGELEEEVKVGRSIRMRKDLTGAVQEVSGKKRFLIRFQDGCKKEYAPE